MLKDGAFEAAVKATNAYAAICRRRPRPRTAGRGTRGLGDGAEEERRDYKPKALARRPMSSRAWLPLNQP